MGKMKNDMATKEFNDGRVFLQPSIKQRQLSVQIRFDEILKETGFANDNCEGTYRSNVIEAHCLLTCSVMRKLARLNNCIFDLVGILMNSEQASGSVWASFKKGDWCAYTSLYNTYYKPLNNYGYKFTKDVSLIEDCIHDLFVKLWNSKANLGEPASVKNYLYKSLRGILLRKLKSNARFRLMESEDDYLNFEVSYDNQLITKEQEVELNRAIQKALSQLPARQREIVYLRFYEGFSYEEIAEVMSISFKSVYKLWYKVQDKLKKSLELVNVLIVSIILSKLGEIHSHRISD